MDLNDLVLMSRPPVAPLDVPGRAVYVMGHQSKYPQSKFVLCGAISPASVEGEEAGAVQCEGQRLCLQITRLARGSAALSPSRALRRKGPSF